MNILGTRNKLKPKYASLTLRIASIGMAIGFVALLMIVRPMSDFLGIEPGECVRCQENGGQWLVFFLGALIAFFYTGIVMAAGFFSLVKFNESELTRREALKYTFFSIFPAKWYEDE